MEERVKVGFERDDRLDRSRRIDWLDVDKISKSSALVLGAGALGNEVAKNLALSGFSTIAIVDFDKVERSNLARCIFFSEIDAAKGLMKAECLARAISAMIPGVQAKGIVGRVEDLNDDAYGEYDAIFGCLDNFNARIHANAHARSAGRPYIDGGMQGTLGRVFVSNAPGPCIECASNITHSRIAARRYSCTGSNITFFEPPVPAEITTTSIVSAVMVREALRIISGSALPEGQMIYYDGQKSTFEVMEVDVDPNCPNHSR